MLNKSTVQKMREEMGQEKKSKGVFGMVAFAVTLLFLLIAASRFYQAVPAGYAAVAALFGKVQPQPYREGLHLPVNPFYSWYFYDIRQKSHKETAGINSQDQLQTALDVSVQYRFIPDMIPKILQETGGEEEVLQVHMVPKLRSLLREQSKSVLRAEDFFLEATQNTLQSRLFEGLKSYMAQKGIDVQAVLIRDIRLPAFITKAIEEKKQREQEVEKQKAELERFKTEQQQRVAAAKAEREAAEETAQQKRLLADAQAYEIGAINKAAGESPAYIKLKALEALQAISKDPAAKLYFLNGSSPDPLPLMHLNESTAAPKP